MQVLVYQFKSGILLPSGDTTIMAALPNSVSPPGNPGTWLTRWMNLSRSRNMNAARHTRPAKIVSTVRLLIELIHSVINLKAILSVTLDAVH